MSKQMKIIMITDNLMKGGKERRLMELLVFLESMDNIKINLVLLKNHIEYNAIYQLKNTRLIILERKIKRDPSIFLKLWNICKNFQPEVVHSWGSQPSVYISPICYIKKIPLINGMITNAFLKKLSSTRFRALLTFPLSTKILSNSKAGLLAYRAPLNKSLVIYNGVHLNRFKNLPSRRQIKQELHIKKPFVVGMVGAFHPRKDYDTFFSAVKKVVRWRDDICFLAIGNGTMLDHYKFVTSEIPSDNLKFLGNRDQIEKYINLFDVGVLLTNTNVHQEGLSNAIIEYMAMGKPVIATEGGGTIELVDNYVNGFLVKPHDDNMFIERLYTLLDNESLRKEFGSNGQKKIQNEFSISIMTNKFLKLYNELCDKS